ncbi:MAG: hypothetical protein KDA58_09785, partial [Planctomycetaceae bacterium]|nr:hypothetical protein [Planctomycetaceae bacterium]
MRRVLLMPVLAALMSLASYGEAEAGLFCGIGRYRCCPVDTCQPCGDYCQARVSCGPSYKTVRETVWCTEEYNECCTVYDTCVEKTPVTCKRVVYDTCYRNECYTVRKPCYHTTYRDVCYTVRKPCYHTCYRDVTCRVRKPCYHTCYRDVCYTVCK